MCQDFDRFTAEHNCGDSAPTVRSHYDQVASFLFRRIDDRPIRMLVLDMGQPTRIADVAARVAANAGRRVEIVYTGLRPGEKLHEDLFNPYERMQPTLPGIEESTTVSSGIVEAPALAEPMREQLSPQPMAKDAPYCYQCGNAMQRAGSCYVCTSCGTTSGCS